MAAQRPNVIVYQEYEEINVVPDIPDLEVLVVGPCYQILDYLDDKANCYADDYGTLDGNTVLPVVPPSAVVIASPPNAEAGAELDSTAVVMYFDEGRAVVVESSGAAAQYATFAASDNLFQAHDTAAGVHFASAGVEAGDILLTNSQGTDDYVMAVKEVLYVLNDFGGTLEFLDGNATFDAVQEGDTVTLSNDGEPNPRDGVYTVTRVRDNANLEFVGSDITWAGHAEGSITGTVTISVADTNGAIRTGYPTTLGLADYSDLRTTADFPLANDGTTREWRTERSISDVELDASDYTISGNEVTVAAGITTDLSATLTGRRVTYSKIYMQYSALRTDLQDVTSLSSTSEMTATLGKYDARNPLMVGAVVAKANTSTNVNVYGLASNDLPGYLDFIDRISSVRDVYAIVPLTYNTSIMAAVNSMCENLADPNYALTHGIKQKFRTTIGAVELATEKYVVTATSGGSTNTISSPAPAGNHLATLTQTGGTAPDFSALGVVPGDILEVHDTSGPSTVQYTITHLNGALVVETDAVVSATGSLSGAGDYVKIIDGVDGVTEKVSAEVGVASVTAVDLAAAVRDQLYLVFEATGAHFISDGATPGDYLQIPEDPNSGTWDAFGTWVIDSVLSEERVRVVNNGNDTSLVANELPHLYRRSDGGAISGGAIYYRVLRAMTKDQQVDNMIEVATSFSSKRMLLCYPDLVDVTDLVDGSITRTVSTVPEVAAAQPGYYLSCAVGGLTAGQPPQQGFTNMGIAGIDRIYNSSEYFTEEQLTDLSNGGVYVFVQDNPAALPYSIHEVTTDVSALEFSEYMVVKDFDFVAWTYLDTLLPFLGAWNVLPETIEFIRQALFSTGDTLKSRYVAKIGAPLTDYSITEVDVSSLSSDRIEAYVDVDLPMTLNTIGLHLVA